MSLISSLHFHSLLAHLLIEQVQLVKTILAILGFEKAFQDVISLYHKV